MKSSKLAAALLSAFFIPFAATCSAKLTPGETAAVVARMLQERHYSRQMLDDTISERMLTLLLEDIDYNRMFFLQSDIDRFNEQYARTLDDAIRRRDVSPVYDIYGVYVERLSRLVAELPGMLADPNLIDPAGFAEIRRNKSPWPKDEEDQRRIWRQQTASAIVQERLNKHALDKPETVVARRYERLLKTAKNNGPEDQAKMLIKTLAKAYDPHSEFNDASEYKSFRIDIGLRLEGIGAILRPDEGYTSVAELVPGGPAAKDGRLKVKDRIVAVAQGDAEFVDVVDMSLDKVVEMIRGEKGTKVRLLVIPARAADPSERKVIELVRDEINLKEKESKAELIEMPDGRGRTIRVGWITIPSFYFDVEQTGRPDAPSTTRHVAKLIARLKKEGAKGLVIDLSRNGGGSLEEAVNLTGLFIKTGPVVQIKDETGWTRKSMDLDPGVAWDGPLVVLTSRFSASASEIFAAALQDYGKAVIVGDRSTYGKGTVQTYMPVGAPRQFLPFMPPPADSDALRVTIQKFYRVLGGSTQFRGVLSDIVLPSLTDIEEVGESSLRFPLPYDEVPALNIERTDLSGVIARLRSRSDERVKANREFQDIKEDFARLTARMEANRISLDINARRAEIEQDKARRKARKEARANSKRPEYPSYQITVETADAPVLELRKAVLDRKREEALRHRADKPADEEEEEDLEDSLLSGERPEIDPIKDETLNILADLIAFTGRPETVQGR